MPRANISLWLWTRPKFNSNRVRACIDYVTICFDRVLYTIAWITAAIVSGLFGDYVKIIYFIKFIYRNRHNKKKYINQFGNL